MRFSIGVGVGLVSMLTSVRISRDVLVANFKLSM